MDYLRMADNIYSDKSSSARPRITRKRAGRVGANSEGENDNAGRLRWVPAAAAGFLTILLCVTINFRAHSETDREAAEREKLNAQIQDLTTDNLTLQGDIQSFKTDPNAIATEAGKLGYQRHSKEKIPVRAK